MTDHNESQPLDSNRPENRDDPETRLPMSGLTGANIEDELKVKLAGRRPDETGDIAIHYHLEGDDTYDYLSIRWRTQESGPHWHRPDQRGEISLNYIGDSDELKFTNYQVIGTEDGIALERFEQDWGHGYDALLHGDFEHAAHISAQLHDAQDLERDTGFAAVNEHEAKKVLGFLRSATDEAAQ